MVTSPSERPRTRSWQLRVLPLMIVMLLGGAILFGTVSILEFRRLDASLAKPASSADISSQLEALSSKGSDLAVARLAIAARLESSLVEQRYGLVRVMLRGRLWTRFMGFITGMIMALVGCAFILGKLRDPGSELRSEGGGMSLSMKSASPGLLLAGLGTILMSLAIVVAPKVEALDGAVYLDGGEETDTARRGVIGTPSPGQGAMPPPPPIEGRKSREELLNNAP